MAETGQSHLPDLSTARLSFSRLKPADAAALYAIENDWEVVRMLAAVPWPLSVGDIESFAARQGGPEAESDDFVLRAGHLVIGVAGVKRPGSGDPPRSMPRLGYWLGRAYWGQGYGREAVAVLTAYAFRRFTADLIGAGVFHDNPASLRILESLGFEEAGSYETLSVSRGVPVRTIDMHLTRAKFESRR